MRFLLKKLGVLFWVCSLLAVNEWAPHHVSPFLLISPSIALDKFRAAPFDPWKATDSFLDLAKSTLSKIISPEFLKAVSVIPGGPDIITDVCTNYPNQDTDGDGIPDCWEITPVTFDNDGVTDLDLRRYGANPLHKDLFVEVDYMLKNKPTPGALLEVVRAFLKAPVKNLDHIDGIHLHLSPDGERASELLDEVVPQIAEIHFDSRPDGPANDFWDIKWGSPINLCGVGDNDGHFGSRSMRSNPNCRKMVDARKAVFRYAIFANTFTEGVVTNEDGTKGYNAGVGELWGDDFLITEGEWEETNKLERRKEESNTFMHELGHTLNLDHGGGDGVNCKPNYLSIMNYSFAFDDIQPDVPLDYSSVTMQDLDEKNLDETTNFSPPAGWWLIFGAGVRKDADGNPFNAIGASPSEQNPVDWNEDGKFSNPSQADINQIPRRGCDGKDENGAQLSVLKSFNDWANLKYSFQDSPSFESPSAQISSQPDRFAACLTNLQVKNTAKMMDADGDGINNWDDNCRGISNPGQEDDDHDGVGNACPPEVLVEPQMALLAVAITDSTDAPISPLPSEKLAPLPYGVPTAPPSPPPAPLMAGDALAYNVYVTNRSAYPAHDVTVVDVLPATVSLSSVNSSVGTFVQSGQLLSWNVGQLEAGGSATLTIDVKTNTATTLIHSAYAYSSGVPDPTNPFPPNAFRKATVVKGREADLSVTQDKIIAPYILVGGLATYNIRVNNKGPSAVNSVMVMDQLPVGAKMENSWASTGYFKPINGGLNWIVGNLNSGSFANAQVTARVGNAGTATNTATISGAVSDTNAADNVSTVSVPILPAAHMVLRQSDSPDPAMVGQTVTYTINVKNDGPSPSTRPLVMDVLPSGTTFVSWNASQGSLAWEGSSVRWDVGPLGVGSLASMTLQVKPTASGAIKNSAFVSGNELDPLQNGDYSRDESTTVNPAPPPQAPTPTSPSGSTSGIVHVADFQASIPYGTLISWNTKVVDSSGSPVSGATVTTEVTYHGASNTLSQGPLWYKHTANTDSQGWARDSSAGATTPLVVGWYEIKVTGVSAPGAAYNSSANSNTAATFTCWGGFGAPPSGCAMQ